MLTPPDLPDVTILAAVRDAYGLPAYRATFLPIGADINAFVYRIDAEDGGTYFLKLKRGGFDEVGVAVPAALRASGVEGVMAPLPTTDDQLWVSGHGFVWILYPFFVGRNGYEVALSDAQWVALGHILRGVHGAMLPASLERRIPREEYSPQWRDAVRFFDQRLNAYLRGDPVAAALAAFWYEQRQTILAMVARADEMAHALRRQAVPFALCHADMHPGNVLVGAQDALTIVDWDNPIFAPKEHDLMCIGGGMGFAIEGDREDALFYRGYGDVEIDPVALAYYRYERIVADVAAYGQQIFGEEGSVEDRELGLRQLTSQFAPRQVVDIANQTYARLP